jgi:hypothetical protein
MRKIIYLLAALVLSCGGFTAAAALPQPLATDSSNCAIGPLDKTYGNAHWLVYGCTDGQNVVVVSAPGNPAMPFYFFFAHTSDGMKLYGEGNGDKLVTDAAFKELQLLSATDVALLYQQAKTVAARGGQ